jgi:hypothetical protein
MMKNHPLALALFLLLLVVVGGLANGYLTARWRLMLASSSRHSIRRTGWAGLARALYADRVAVWCARRKESGDWLMRLRWMQLPLTGSRA